MTPRRFLALFIFFFSAFVLAFGVRLVRSSSGGYLVFWVLAGVGCMALAVFLARPPKTDETHDATSD